MIRIEPASPVTQRLDGRHCKYGAPPKRRSFWDKLTAGLFRSAA